MSAKKLVHVFGERDVNGYNTVWWTGRHTYRHVVGVEGNTEAELFLGVWRNGGSPWRVRNRVFDKESNFNARTRLRSIIPEEGVTRKRNSGV